MTATDKMLARKEGRVGTIDLQQPGAPQRRLPGDVERRQTRILEDFARDDDVRVVVG